MNIKKMLNFKKLFECIETIVSSQPFLTKLKTYYYSFNLKET